MHSNPKRYTCNILLAYCYLCFNNATFKQKALVVSQMRNAHNTENTGHILMLIHLNLDRLENLKCKKVKH